MRNWLNINAPDLLVSVELLRTGSGWGIVRGPTRLNLQRPEFVPAVDEGLGCSLCVVVRGSDCLSTFLNSDLQEFGLKGELQNWLIMNAPDLLVYRRRISTSVLLYASDGYRARGKGVLRCVSVTTFCPARNQENGLSKSDNLEVGVAPQTLISDERTTYKSLSQGGEPRDILCLRPRPTSSDSVKTVGPQCPSIEDSGECVIPRRRVAPSRRRFLTQTYKSAPQGVQQGSSRPSSY